MLPVTLMSSVAANANGASLNCQGAETATFLISGTFDARVVFEATLDGTLWFPFAGDTAGGVCSSFASNPTYAQFSVEGIQLIRPRTVDYRSGNVTVVGFAKNRRSQGNSFMRFSTATAGTLVNSGACSLNKIVINNPGSGMVVTIHNGTSTGAPVIANISAQSTASISYDITCTAGIFVVISATTMGDVTIAFTV